MYIHLNFRGLSEFGPRSENGYGKGVIFNWSKIWSEFEELGGTQSNPTTNHDDYPTPSLGILRIIHVLVCIYNRNSYVL